MGIPAVGTLPKDLKKLRKLIASADSKDELNILFEAYKKVGGNFLASNNYKAERDDKKFADKVFEYIVGDCPVGRVNDFVGFYAESRHGDVNAVLTRLIEQAATTDLLLMAQLWAKFQFVDGSDEKKAEFKEKLIQRAGAFKGDVQAAQTFSTALQAVGFNADSVRAEMLKDSITHDQAKNMLAIYRVAPLNGSLANFTDALISQIDNANNAKLTWLWQRYEAAGGDEGVYQDKLYATLNARLNDLGVADFAKRLAQSGVTKDNLIDKIIAEPTADNIIALLSVCSESPYAANEQERNNNIQKIQTAYLDQVVNADSAQLEILYQKYTADFVFDEEAYKKTLMDRANVRGDNLTTAELAARFDQAGIRAADIQAKIVTQDANVGDARNLLAVYPEMNGANVDTLEGQLRSQIDNSNNLQLQDLWQKYQALPADKQKIGDYQAALLNRVEQLGDSLTVQDLYLRLLEAGLSNDEIRNKVIDGQSVAISCDRIKLFKHSDGADAAIADAINDAGGLRDRILDAATDAETANTLIAIYRVAQEADLENLATSLVSSIAGVGINAELVLLREKYQMVQVGDIVAFQAALFANLPAAITPAQLSAHVVELAGGDDQAQAAFIGQIAGADSDRVTLLREAAAATGNYDAAAFQAELFAHLPAAITAGQLSAHVVALAGGDDQAQAAFIGQIAGADNDRVTLLREAAAATGNYDAAAFQNELFAHLPAAITAGQLSVHVVALAGGDDQAQAAFIGQIAGADNARITLLREAAAATGNYDAAAFQAELFAHLPAAITAGQLSAHVVALAGGDDQAQAAFIGQIAGADSDRVTLLREAAAATGNYDAAAFQTELFAHLPAAITAGQLSVHVVALAGGDDQAQAAFIGQIAGADNDRVTLLREAAAATGNYDAAAFQAGLFAHLPAAITPVELLAHVVALAGGDDQAQAAFIGQIAGADNDRVTLLREAAAATGNYDAAAFQNELFAHLPAAITAGQLSVHVVALAGGDDQAQAAFIGQIAGADNARITLLREAAAATGNYDAAAFQAGLFAHLPAAITAAGLSVHVVALAGGDDQAQAAFIGQIAGADNARITLLREAAVATGNYDAAAFQAGLFAHLPAAITPVELLAHVVALAGGDDQAQTAFRDQIQYAANDERVTLLRAAHAQANGDAAAFQAALFANLPAAITAAELSVHVVALAGGDAQAQAAFIGQIAGADNDRVTLLREAAAATGNYDAAAFQAELFAHLPAAITAGQLSAHVVALAGGDDQAQAAFIGQIAGADNDRVTLLREAAAATGNYDAAAFQNELFAHLPAAITAGQLSVHVVALAGGDDQAQAAFIGQIAGADNARITLLREAAVATGNYDAAAFQAGLFAHLPAAITPVELLAHVVALAGGDDQAQTAFRDQIQYATNDERVTLLREAHAQANGDAAAFQAELFAHLPAAITAGQLSAHVVALAGGDDQAQAAFIGQIAGADNDRVTLLREAAAATGNYDAAAFQAGLFAHLPAAITPAELSAHVVALAGGDDQAQAAFIGQIAGADSDRVTLLREAAVATGNYDAAALQAGLFAHLPAAITPVELLAHVVALAGGDAQAQAAFIGQIAGADNARITLLREAAAATGNYDAAAFQAALFAHLPAAITPAELSVHVVALAGGDAQAQAAFIGQIAGADNDRLTLLREAHAQANGNAAAFQAALFANLPAAITAAELSVHVVALAGGDAQAQAAFRDQIQHAANNDRVTLLREAHAQANGDAAAFQAALFANLPAAITAAQLSAHVVELAGGDAQAQAAFRDQIQHAANNDRVTLLRAAHAQANGNAAAFQAALFANLPAAITAAELSVHVVALAGGDAQAQAAFRDQIQHAANNDRVTLLRAAHAQANGDAAAFQAALFANLPAAITAAELSVHVVALAGGDAQAQAAFIGQIAGADNDRVTLLREAAAATGNYDAAAFQAELFAHLPAAITAGQLSAHVVALAGGDDQAQAAFIGQIAGADNDRVTLLREAAAATGNYDAAAFQNELFAHLPAAITAGQLSVHVVALAGGDDQAQAAFIGQIAGADNARITLLREAAVATGNYDAAAFQAGLFAHLPAAITPVELLAHVVALAGGDDQAQTAFRDQIQYAANDERVTLLREAHAQANGDAAAFQAELFAHLPAAITAGQLSAHVVALAGGDDQAQAAFIGQIAGADNDRVTLLREAAAATGNYDAAAFQAGLFAHLPAAITPAELSAHVVALAGGDDQAQAAFIGQIVGADNDRVTLLREAAAATGNYDAAAFQTELFAHLPAAITAGQLSVHVVALAGGDDQAQAAFIGQIAGADNDRLTLLRAAHAQANGDAAAFQAALFANLPAAITAAELSVHVVALAGGDAQAQTAFRDQIQYAANDERVTLLREAHAQANGDAVAFQAGLFAHLPAAITAGQLSAHVVALAGGDDQAQAAFIGQIAGADNDRVTLLREAAAATGNYDAAAFQAGLFAHLPAAITPAELSAHVVALAGGDDQAQAAFIGQIAGADSDRVTLLREAAVATGNYDAAAFQAGLFAHLPAAITPVELLAHVVALAGGDAQAQAAFRDQIQHAVNNARVTLLREAHAQANGDAAAFQAALFANLPAAITAAELSVHVVALAGGDAQAQAAFIGQIAGADNDRLTLLREAHAQANGDAAAFQAALFANLPAAITAAELSVHVVALAGGDAQAQAAFIGQIAGADNDRLTLLREAHAQANGDAAAFQAALFANLPVAITAAELSVHVVALAGGDAQAQAAFIGQIAGADNDRLTLLREAHAQANGDAAVFQSELLSQSHHLINVASVVTANQLSAQIRQAGIANAEALRTLLQALINDPMDLLSVDQLTAIKAVHTEMGGDEAGFDNALIATVTNLGTADPKINTAADLHAIHEVVDAARKEALYDQIVARSEYIFPLAEVDQAAFQTVTQVMSADTRDADGAAQALDTYVTPEKAREILDRAGNTITIHDLLAAKDGAVYVVDNEFVNNLIQAQITEFVELLKSIQKHPEIRGEWRQMQADGAAVDPAGSTKMLIQGKMQAILDKLDRLNQDQPFNATDSDNYSDDTQFHARSLLQQRINEDVTLGNKVVEFCNKQQNQISQLVGCHLNADTSRNRFVGDLQRDLDDLCQTADRDAALNYIERLPRTVAELEIPNRVSFYNQKARVATGVRNALYARARKLMAIGVSPEVIARAYNQLNASSHDKKSNIDALSLKTKMASALPDLIRQLASRNAAEVKAEIAELIACYSRDDINISPEHKDAFFKALQAGLPKLIKNNVYEHANAAGPREYNSVRDALRGNLSGGARIPEENGTIRGELDAQLQALLEDLPERSPVSGDNTWQSYKDLFDAINDGAAVREYIFGANFDAAANDDHVLGFILAGFSVEGLSTHSKLGDKQITSAQICAKLTHGARVLLEQITALVLEVNDALSEDNKATATANFDKVARVCHMLGHSGEKQAVRRAIEAQIRANLSSLIERGFNLSDIQRACPSIHMPELRQAIQQNNDLAPERKDALVARVERDVVSQGVAGTERQAHQVFFDAMITQDASLNTVINNLPESMKDKVTRAVFLAVQAHFSEVIGADGQLDFGNVDQSIIQEIIRDVQRGVNTEIKRINDQSVQRAKEMGLSGYAESDSVSKAQAFNRQMHDSLAGYDAALEQDESLRRQESTKLMKDSLGKGTQKSRAQVAAAKKMHATLQGLEGDENALAQTLRAQRDQTVEKLEAKLEAAIRDAETIDAYLKMDLMGSYKGAFMMRLEDYIDTLKRRKKETEVEKYNVLLEKFKRMTPKELFLKSRSGFLGLEDSANANMLEELCRISTVAIVDDVCCEIVKNRANKVVDLTKATTLFNARSGLMLSINDIEKRLNAEKRKNMPEFKKEARRLHRLRTRADQLQVVPLEDQTEAVFYAQDQQYELGNKIDPRVLARAFANQGAAGPAIANVVGEQAFVDRAALENRKSVLVLDKAAKRFVMHTVTKDVESHHVKVAFDGAALQFFEGAGAGQSPVGTVDYSRLTKADIQRMAAKDGIQLAATYHAMLEADDDDVIEDRVVYLQSYRFDFPRGKVPNQNTPQHTRYVEAYQKAMHNLLRVEAAYQTLKRQGYEQFEGPGKEAFLQARRARIKEITAFNDGVLAETMSASERAGVIQSCSQEALSEEVNEFADVMHLPRVSVR